MQVAERIRDKDVHVQTLGDFHGHLPWIMRMSALGMLGDGSPRAKNVLWLKDFGRQLDSLVSELRRAHAEISCSSTPLDN